MREILEEIKVLQRKSRGCVPNFRGASPVGRDKGGCSYAARTVDGRRLDWATSGKRHRPRQ